MCVGDIDGVAAPLADAVEVVVPVLDKLVVPTGLGVAEPDPVLVPVAEVVEAPLAVIVTLELSQAVPVLVGDDV